MGDKATLGERVDELLINPDVIERIDIFQKGDHEEPYFSVPNTKDTQKSLQIYAAITNNESMITPEGAEKGLTTYGEELREEAKDGIRHGNIRFLEQIAKSGKSVHSHVVTSYSTKPIPEHVRRAMPEIAEKFGTPVHVYDEDGIRQTCRDLNSAFSWVPGGFRNFFAVKACPNPTLIALMKKEGFGADCSSAPELNLAYAAGMDGEDKMFTSNDTPDSEFRDANSRCAIINLDDITHIAAFERATGGLPNLLCFRYAGDECEGNSIIGSSEERKYGLTREQIFEAYRTAKEKGVKRFGLHAMMVSNERNVKKHLQQAEKCSDFTEM